MKRFAFLLLLIPFSAHAQATHSVTLNWTASSDTGGTINVYRATASCASSSTYTKLTTGVAAAGPYVDSTVTISLYSYYVTAVVNGVESVPSNCVNANVLPFAPTNLTAVIK